MSRIMCKIIPTTITGYNFGRRTSVTSSWPCDRLVNGTTIHLQEITHPYMYSVRHGCSALCPLCTSSHDIFTCKCYKRFLSKKWVRSWYSEIKPLYFSETLGLRFCRTETPLSTTVALGKTFVLFILYHQHCKLCYEFLLCSKNLYWSARVYQEY